MNNTSAYANVLLKPSVAASVAAAPKRDYQDDFSLADFHQTLKDVHESQKSQNEKISKSANHKKPAHVERHSDTKNTKEIKDVNPLHEAATKQKPADTSAEVNQSTTGNQVVREQPIQHKNNEMRADKVTGDGTVQDAGNLVADINSEVSQDALIVSTTNGLDIGVNQSSLVLVAELITPVVTSVPVVANALATTAEPVPPQDIPVSTDINVTLASVEPTTPSSPLLAKSAAVTSLDVVALTPISAHSITAETIEASTTASPLPVKSESVTALDVATSSITPKVIDPATPASLSPVKSESMTALDLAAVAPIEPSTTRFEAESLANVSPDSGASVKLDKSGEVISQPLVTDESLPQQNLSQQLAASSQVINQPIDPAALAVTQVLTAGVMVSSATKPLQPQIALAEVSDEVDLLAPLVPEISASAKVAPASNLATTSLAVNSEVTTTQVQMSESKTIFEKTLQAIVSPDAGGADDMAAPVLNSSSTNSATNPLMDSLMRGADQQTPAARSFVVQTAVPVPVGQPQWSQAVGEKVLWLAAQNVSSAEINLHPKDLGPMQVRVSVNQEQTTVNFTSHHAVVREVLDQNLNRLRDMFSEQGLNLVNVDVSDKSFSRQQGDAQGQKGQGGSQDVASEEETAITMSAIVQQRLVDHYA